MMISNTFYGLIILCVVHRVVCQKLDAKYWRNKYEYLDLVPPEPFYTRSIPFGELELPSEFNSNRDDRFSYASSTQYCLFTGNHTWHPFHTHLASQVYVFIRGHPVDFYMIDKVNGSLAKTTLGLTGDDFVLPIPTGSITAIGWKNLKPNFRLYSLMTATTYPGYQIADKIILDREDLTRDYPQHTRIIRKFTAPANA